MDSLKQDLRSALRVFRASPGFVIVTVLSLALGLGVNTTLFSLVTGVLLRPVPAADPARVMTLEKGGGMYVTSYPDYVDLRDRARAMGGLAAWSEATAAIATDAGVERAYGLLVSGNYFSVLGLRPALGRLLTPDDDQVPGAHPVVVLSHSSWRRRFGGDSGIVGRVVRLNGSAFTVAGVAPAGFTSTIAIFAPDFYAPLMMQPQLAPRVDLQSHTRSRWVKLVGRLAAGSSREQAAAELTTIDRQLWSDRPPPEGSLDRERAKAPIALTPVDRLPTDMRVAVAGMIAVLAALVGLVLLIACANVAGMLLARGIARRQEFAVRVALGASRGRLVRQLLTETALLFLVAGAAGVLAAVWLGDLIMAVRPPVPLPVSLDLAVGARVAVFGMVLALTAGLLFGLTPALQGAREDLSVVLKGAASARQPSRGRARNRFVVGQLALTTLLLVAGGLFLRALARGRTVYPGSDPTSLQVIEIGMTDRAYPPARQAEVYRRILERAVALPGVRGAAYASDVPVGDGYSRTDVTVGGRELPTEFTAVSPGYFGTVGIPLVRGRDFAATDVATGNRVAIVNETFARRVWPGADPLGKRVRHGDVDVEVVGVAQDMRLRAAVTGHGAYLYEPVAQQSSSRDLSLHLRTAGDPKPVLAELRREVASIDPSLPIDRALSMADLLDVVLLPQRVAALAAAAFGLVALVLGALGVYGIVAQAAGERRGELAVRVALGATARDVTRLVAGHGLRLAVTGTAIGLVLALGATRLLRSLLFGLSATDVGTLLGVAALLAAMTLLASLAPARRAARVDPAQVLRRE